MTYTARSPQGSFSLVLPGTWAAIPLDDEDVLRERVRSLVLERVGRNDRLARVRKDARDELIRTALRARTAGASAFWMSLEVLPGIPLPAALMVTERAWAADATALAGATPDVGAAAPTESDITARLRTFRPDAELIELRTGPAARISEYGPEAVGDEQEPSLFLEYTVPAPDGARYLSITVSAPMAQDAKLYTMFFDAIVDSLTWAEVAA